MSFWIWLFLVITVVIATVIAIKVAEIAFFIVAMLIICTAIAKVLNDRWKKKKCKLK